MQFYDVIEKRKSIKKFKSSPINEEKLNRIIKATMMAPSWKNKTSYKFILIKKEEEKNKIADTILNSTNEAKNSVEEAPMVAIVVADPSLSGEVNNREYYLVDSAIAMEHFILAATEEGYGTCFIGAIDEDKIKDIAKIPNNYRVVAITPIGEIAEYAEHYPEKNIKDYIFIDHFNNPYSSSSSMKH